MHKHITLNSQTQIACFLFDCIIWLNHVPSTCAGLIIVDHFFNAILSQIPAEARACMSVVSSAHRTTYGTAQATFATNVDALPTTATDIEICG